MFTAYPIFMKRLITTLLLLSFGTSLCVAQQQQIDQFVYTCGGSDSVLLSVDSLTNPGCTYTWYREGVLIAANTSQAHLVVTDTGKYTVVANSPAGCSSDFSNSLIVRLKSLYANDDSAHTNYGATVNIGILDNDNMGCYDLDPSSIVIVNRPKYGGLSITNGIAIYMPDMDYTGVDSFKYTVADINGNVSNVAKVKITIGEVPHSESEDISIYPNPASDFLYVRGDYTQIATIMLVTDRGRIIYETVPTKAITAINVSHYAQAVYFVRIVYKTGKQSGHKVMVGK